MSVIHQNIRRRISLGQDNNSLTWLIIINAVIFILLYLFRVVYLIEFGKVEEQAALNAFHAGTLNWLGLSPNLSTFIIRPWTLLLYMITHETVMGILSNMLWLWAFGFILQDLTGNSKLIPLYFYGGLTGAICFLIVSAFTGAAIPIVGAGAAIMAIMVATTTLQPGYRLFTMLHGGIPLWIVSLIFVAIDFTAISNGNDAAANIAAHVGGGLIGYIFILRMQKGKDWGEWMENFSNWISNLFNPEKNNKKIASKENHFYKAERTPYSKTPHITQQRLDEILDKINKHGYQLLSNEEKDFLKKASKEDI